MEAKPKITVLAIDDDAGDALLLARQLEDLEAWEIELITCTDPEVGKREAAQRRCDVIFIDYMLGETTGVQLFEEMRAGGDLCPVIMLTGQGSEEIAVEAMKAGATDYLVKGSVTPHALHRAIANALERARMQEVIARQRRELIEAEQQRVMIESLGAACHHLSQPLTAMLGNLELLRSVPLEDPRRDALLDQCLQATDRMGEVLRRLQAVREYRTQPYIQNTAILDIGLDI